MLIEPIKTKNNNYGLLLEECIDEAYIFFKNKGIKYQSLLNNNEKPQHFNEALREYINLKFNDKTEEIIKNIPLMIIKYYNFFNEGKSVYNKYNN